VSRVEASRELLASRTDVWKVLAEPYNLSSWWPGIGGLEPDRRGFAPGARWHVVGENRPSFLRKPNMSGTLVVLAVDLYERFSFHLTGERVDVELRLAAPAPDRTLATLTVEGPSLIGLKRALPKQALARLHALCQTAADL
jgi:uncharacterized protein YndB with AHSA1/START domain